MCQMASFFHNPATGEVRVSVLDHHESTAQALGLDQKVWREGHYLPNGKIDTRVAPEDRVTADKCAERIRSRWPTFCKFLSWAFKESGVCDEKGHYAGSLDLGGLTSAEHLTLPMSIGGWLDLNGLTSAKGLTLPTSIGGGLVLSSLTSAKGLKLPKSIGGWLVLSSLTSAEREEVMAKWKKK